MIMYQAITVTRFYLDKKKWCIKWLTVEYRKDGIPYWFVRAHLIRDGDKYTSVIQALKIANDLNIPYIPNINKGMNLTKKHIAVLKKYSVIV